MAEKIRRPASNTGPSRFKCRSVDRSVSFCISGFCGTYADNGQYNHSYVIYHHFCDGDLLTPPPLHPVNLII